MTAIGPKSLNALHALHGSHLRFAVEGARAFRPPQGLGLTPYEGCHIAVFELGDAPPLEAFVRAAQAEGDTSLTIAGVKVIRVRWRAEHDDWEAFVVRPRPDVIIVSTSEPMLVGTLGRAMRGGPGRALPPSLLEWTALDTTARIWALRHYARSADDRDPTSPITTGLGAGKALDTLAIGMTVSIANDSSGVIAHYFSRSPQVMTIAKHIWAHPGYPPGTSFRSDINGSVRVSIASQSSDTPEERGVRLLILLGVLGHAFYI